MKHSSQPNSYVLITGASAGIGKALAVEFARCGHDLLLVALPGTGLEEVQDELLDQFDVDVNILCKDLTQQDSPAEVYAWCRANAYDVSTLVNNAGFGNLERFEESSAQLLCNMMELNNRAVIMLTHLFIPELRKFKQSYIMNVGSLASFMPIPGKSVYAASKSFIYSFSQSLHLELVADNIHVSCLCPGGTMTQRTQLMMNGIHGTRKAFCQQPADVARIAVDGLYKKEFRIVPGFVNGLLYWLSQLLPMTLKVVIIKSVFRKKKPTSSRMRTPIRNRSFVFSFGMVAR